jgi:hypothetical protein
VESQRLQLGALGAEMALLQGQLADKEQLVGAPARGRLRLWRAAARLRWCPRLGPRPGAQDPAPARPQVLDLEARLRRNQATVAEALQRAAMSPPQPGLFTTPAPHAADPRPLTHEALSPLSFPSLPAAGGPTPPAVAVATGGSLEQPPSAGASQPQSRPRSLAQLATGSSSGTAEPTLMMPPIELRLSLDSAPDAERALLTQEIEVGALLACWLLAAGCWATWLLGNVAAGRTWLGAHGWAHMARRTWLGTVVCMAGQCVAGHAAGRMAGQLGSASLWPRCPACCCPLATPACPCPAPSEVPPSPRS